MPKQEKKVEKKDFDRYLAEARSWETDKVQQSEKSKKIAWWIAAAGVVVGVLGTASATLQATRAPAPPVVLRVDNTTGIVDTIKPLANGKTNYEEVVNKYFTQLYVRYREGYSKELAPDYYTSVGIMSVGLEQQKYYEWFNPKNPQSPLNVYGPYAKVKVRIKSTSFIKPNVALVRYTKDIERGLDKPQVSHWAATITFKYSGAAMLEKDRAINPLGFQVVEYRNDNDAQGDTPTATAAAQPTLAQPPANNVVLFPGQGTYQGTAPPAPAQPAVPAPAAVQTTAPVVPAVQALK
jgi:type IV secretion system protein VirB8